MNTPIMHPCGLTLVQLAQEIRNAIRRSYLRMNRLDRKWHYDQQVQHKFHPSVIEALELGAPRDLHKLVLEHPHISTDGRLAYTQNDDKGKRDIQTVTTVGRYLTRHFPCFEDHQIRTIAAKKQGCRIVETMEEMQDALMRGPSSCMKWSSKENPYLSYCPTLGWALAINEANGDIVGRALVHKPTKTFVRTYRKNDNTTTSCELLQGWLKHQGFTHAHDWEDGTKLLLLPRNAPYLDGCEHKASQEDGFWVVDSEGDYTLDRTDGSYQTDDDESIGSCECCGDSVSEDDGDRIYAGEHDEELICGSCSNDFVYAYGRRANQYYVSSNDATYINGRYYHDDFLGDQHELRQLENGDYALEDDCFFCDVVEEYYLCSQETCVCLANGNYAAECNAWQCTVSGEWYGDDEDPVIVDGEKVHPDNVVEPEEENEQTEDDVGIHLGPETSPQRAGCTNVDQLFADLVAQCV